MVESGAPVGLALVAGETVWSDTDEEPTGLVRLVSLGELLVLAGIASSLWLMRWSRSPEPTGLAAWAPWIGSAAALVAAIRPTRLILGSRAEARLWPSVVWRSVVLIVLAGCLVANLPRWGVLALWPIGILAGAEAALGSWAIGHDIRPVRWYRDFLASWLHLGAIGALVAALVGRGGAGAGLAVLSYASLLLLAATACVTAAILDWVRLHQLAEEQRIANALVAREHTERAHWLHDQVSSQVRTLSLRVQHESPTTDEMARMLDEFDAAMRQRQLDELLASGKAALAEVIQPAVRMVQRNELRISAVPTFDDASLVVDATVGRLVARVASVFTSNAIQAGASEVGFHISHTADAIELSISDDAGGLDLATVPSGRALWQLRRDLGGDRLTATPNGGGTTMTATIDRDPAAHAAAGTSRIGTEG